MSEHYEDYVWKNGIPFGVRKCAPEEAATYKVISDPYYKRISIEKYVKGHFDKVIYDSALFDFRQLRANQQMAWEKKDVSPTVAHIHNQEDRLVLIEEYSFEGTHCRKCEIKTPHGCSVGMQKMFYTALKDAFNGVVLFDANQHQVIKKNYDVDPNTGEFSTLLSESWELSSHG